MKIVKTKDPNSIKFINDKVQDLIEKEGITEYNKNLFIKWLRQSMSNPFVGFWIAVEEKEESVDFNVLGFIVASIQSNLMKEYINISQILGSEEVEKALLEKVDNWAKENGIDEIMTTSRHPNRWKNYGFEVDYHILSKKESKVQQEVKEE